MKNQRAGVYYMSYFIALYAHEYMNTPATNPHCFFHCLASLQTYCAAGYAEKRINGNKECRDMPYDGKYTWTKGEVKGEYVYGVKESDGKYHYEVRYDEGPKDKAFMEEGDWEYIQGLMRDGTLLEKEPNADIEIAADHKYRVEITRALNEARTEKAKNHEDQVRTEAAEIRRLADAAATIAKKVETLDTDSQHYAIEAERCAYLADQRAKTQADIDASQKIEEQSKKAMAATREVVKQSRIITDAEAEIRKQASIATDALQQAETQRRDNPTAVAEVKRFADIATAAALEAKKYFDVATAALVSAKSNAATVIEAYKEAENGDISLQKKIEKREECETRVATLPVAQSPTVSTGSGISPTVVSFWHARCSSKTHAARSTDVTSEFIGERQPSKEAAQADLKEHFAKAHSGRETPSGRVSPAP